MRILSLRFENINSLKGAWKIDFSQAPFDNSGLLLDTPTCHGWDMDNASAIDPPPNTSGEVVLSKNVLRSLKAVEDITAAIARDNMTDTVTGKTSPTRHTFGLSQS